MAIYHATAIARRLKKSAGEQTFCRSKGRDVVKMKVEENTSNTPAQQRQRLAWKRGQELEGLFSEASSIGFPSRPEYQSFHNAFMQANGGVVTVNEEMEVSVDYERVVCAKGSLQVPRGLAVTLDGESRQLTFTHDQEGNGYGKKKEDRLYAVVVEKELKELEVQELKQRSDEEPGAFMLPTGWSAEQLAVYVFMLSEDRRKASDSKYVEVKQV